MPWAMHRERLVQIPDRGHFRRTPSGKLGRTRVQTLLRSCPPRALAVLEYRYVSTSGMTQLPVKLRSAIGSHRWHDSWDLESNVGLFSTSCRDDGCRFSRVHGRGGGSIMTVRFGPVSLNTYYTMASHGLCSGDNAHGTACGWLVGQRAPPTDEKSAGSSVFQEES